jgi:hypothetical protein
MRTPAWASGASIALARCPTRRRALEARRRRRGELVDRLADLRRELRQRPALVVGRLEASCSTIAACASFSKREELVARAGHEPGLVARDAGPGPGEEALALGRRHRCTPGSGRQGARAGPAAAHKNGRRPAGSPKTPFSALSPPPQTGQPAALKGS